MLSPLITSLLKLGLGYYIVVLHTVVDISLRPIEINTVVAALVHNRSYIE
jgi:hypothetical protein